MAHSSSIFNAQPKRVPNRNGFDLSHVHSGTSKCGQLVPVLTKLLVPNSTISLGVNAEVNLPPLVSPFFGKVDFCIEGFVVPLSILYGGWKHFISNNEASMFPSSQDALVNNTSAATVTRNEEPLPKNNFTKNGYLLPHFNALEVARGDVAGFVTLAGTNDNIYEYMGATLSQMAFFPSTTQLGDAADVSLLPGLAYHRICDVFYRNTKLTKTWFEVNPNWVYEVPSITGVAGYPAKKNVSLVWHSWYNSFRYGAAGSATSISVTTAVAKFGATAELTFPDSTSFFSTRQRCYTRDYFTSAVQSPQQGGASTLRFSLSNISGTDPTGEFTINALRMANSLQKFLETNNLSGDYAEQMRNRWGVRPIDADFDEPHYLGRVVVPVYQHTLYQNNQLSTIDLADSKNPYVAAGLLGAKGGASEARAEGSICDNFTCTTWAYLMVLASLVPHANYNYGNNKELFATKLGDYPAPELQGVGMEPIQNSEIYGYAPSSGSASNYANTFGYTQRYARFKYMDDRVSGELKPGNTLQYFQLQRNFSDFPQLGTSFVTIAQDALDGVLTVATAEMKMTCWWEIFFKFHVIQPLAEYCIPTLGEMPDTHEIKTTQGGSRL